jgi:hypothetical protein
MSAGSYGPSSSVKDLGCVRTYRMMAHVSELSRTCCLTAVSTASFTGGGTSFGERAQKI